MVKPVNGPRSVVEVVTVADGGDRCHLDRFYTARGFTDDGRSLLGRALT